MILFIFNICKAVEQQVDRKYTANFSKKKFCQIGHFGPEDSVSSFIPWKRPIGLTLFI